MVRILVLFLVCFNLSSFEGEFKILGQDYAPYNWKEGAEVKGALVDLYTKACQQLKIKCTFDIMPLKRGSQLLEDGSAHMFMALQKTAEREKLFYFSEPITYADINIYTQKGKGTELVSDEQLAGYSLGVLGNSATEKIGLKIKDKIPTLLVIPENDQQTVIKKLAAGRYGDKGALLANKQIVDYYAKQFNVSKDIEVRYTKESNDFFVIFSKKSVPETMVSEFNKVIAELKNSGDMKKIYEKWGINLPR